MKLVDVRVILIDHLDQPIEQHGNNEGSPRGQFILEDNEHIVYVQSNGSYSTFYWIARERR